MARNPPFKFEDPVLHELANLEKAYYLQRVAHDNGFKVLITTDWFQSDGIKSGYNNKDEMQFEVKGVVRETLNAIEAEAVRQLKIPLDVLREHNIHPELPIHSLYRPLNQADFLYARLQRNCPMFNKSGRQIFKRHEAGFGEYRILLHVVGLYIGEHTRDNKLASLQLRIEQIQYREANLVCLMDSSPGLCKNPTLFQSNSMPTPLATSTPNKPPVVAPNAPKKAARSRSKPTLQRQNAVMESQLLNQTLENAAIDFMADLNV